MSFPGSLDLTLHKTSGLRTWDPSLSISTRLGRRAGPSFWVRTEKDRGKGTFGKGPKSVSRGGYTRGPNVVGEGP